MRSSVQKMRNSIRGTRRVILTAVFLLLSAIIICFAFYSKYDRNKPTAISAQNEKNTGMTVSVMAQKKAINGSVSPDSKPISEPEIKKKYGKLEIIYLYNGKRYIGAVDSYGDIYRFVTKNGVLEIPVNEVKMIEIVR